ncbi:hypothetical protein MK079_04100 [Candidatus Gracilibacteria bacterium]|nr:hypothetical protein [Candidatus Gracilibacteria bacterium]
MKKIILCVALLLSSFVVLADTFAETPSNKGTIVTVTEKIPGLGKDACKEVKETVGKGEDAYERITYECTIESGFGSVQKMMGGIIKYFTFLAGLFAVLFIIINGIMYSMSGLDSGMKDEAKKRIIATLLGLVVLLLSGVILNIVAPWVYR